MAVFTPVDEAEAEPFIRGFGLGRLHELAAIVEGVENTNYRIETDRGRYVLTLFENRTDEAGLPFCLGLTEHAADHGLPCARLLRDQAGQTLGRLNGRPAAILEWLPGAWRREPSAHDLEQAGRMLARLHLAGRDFKLVRADPVGREARRRLYARCLDRADGRAAEMLTVMAPFVAPDAPDPAEGLPSGPIHADWFPDNILFDGDGLSGVIDFYLGCTGAWAYDLAVALSAWGFNAQGERLPGAVEAFQAGYEAVRPLTLAERAALPRLGAVAAVRFTLTRLNDLLFHDPETLVQPKDPEAFFRRLEWWTEVTPAD